MEIKEHWNNIYSTKRSTEVSWYQSTPETSLGFFHELSLPKDAAIIDIGGGDSSLAESLLAEGYTNITVLDISDKAIARVQERMGERAEKIKWLVADVIEFSPEESYDLWHDRAAFHFLTEEEQIEKYVRTLGRGVTAGGFVILGTFSRNGPTRCSGIDIKQYDTADLVALLQEDFNSISCKNVLHQTPSGSVQDFSFCSFRKV